MTFEQKRANEPTNGIDKKKMWQIWYDNRDSEVKFDLDVETEAEMKK